MNQELVKAVSRCPVKSINYQQDGQEFEIECEADAHVSTDELIKVFHEIKRFLPPIKAHDVTVDIVTSPGPTSKSKVHWSAHTKRGKLYLREIARAIGHIYTKKLDFVKPQIQNARLSSPNRKEIGNG